MRLRATQIAALGGAVVVLVLGVLMIRGGSEERSSQAGSQFEPSTHPLNTEMYARKAVAEQMRESNWRAPQAPPRLPVNASFPDADKSPTGAIGGFDFPDLGDGNPFEDVQMTVAESEELFSMFSEFLARQSEIDGKLGRGEISALEAAQMLGDVQVELGVRVEEVFGAERTLQLAKGIMAWNAKAMELIAAGEEVPLSPEALDSDFAGTARALH